MKVHELIKKLHEFDPDATVMIEHMDNDGCDTCGWGATEIHSDIQNIIDLETKVILSILKT